MDFASVGEQMKAISRGAVDIINREELERKLEHSRAEGTRLRIKLGVDPTSPDIHLGHTVVLKKLRAFQDLGHQAVLIIGDYTARVGDPSGRNKTRPELSSGDVEANARTYLDQVSRILDASKLEIVRNSEWFARMSFLDVLQLARRMTVARLLERDDFAKRYSAGNPIALHELLYPLMQGWDSVVVRADVELGGNDQLFNLLVGRDFQRNEGQEPQVAVTMPLLVGLDGKEKMSKSYGNYVGVTDAPGEMFGKLMSIPDALTRTYFELLTDVAMDEVDAALADPFEAKKRLAAAITAEFHSAEAAEAARREFERVFSRRELPSDIPEVTLASEDLLDGRRIMPARLVTKARLAPSTSEARRLVAQGAVSLDGEKVTDSREGIEVADGQILRVGKRRFARIRLNS